MNFNLTHLAILVDRSGSMSSIKDDMEGGLKSLVEEQKKAPGDIVVSLYQFDNAFDTIVENASVDCLNDYTLTPRGGTALHDATGRSIIQLGKNLRETPEKERPGKVLFVIITDGGENCSREFTSKQVKDLIKEQEEKYNWKFAYIGANQDSFAVGGNIGVSRGSTMNYVADSIGVRKMSETLGTYVCSAKLSTNSSEFSSISFNGSNDEKEGSPVKQFTTTSKKKTVTV